MAYTQEQLMTALRAADAAGDADGARRIAAMIQSQTPAAGGIITPPAATDTPEAVATEPERGGIGDVLYENIVGRGEIDTFGERLGSVINSAGAGVARGAAGLGGLLGDVRDLSAAGGEKLASKLGASDEVAKIFGESILGGSPLGGAPSSSDTIGLLSQLTGGATDYVGNTRADRIAGTVGEFVPATALFGVASPQNLARYAGIAGAGSELAGEATEGTKLEPYARVAGAMLAPAASAKLGEVARRAVTPKPADPARLALADRLTELGIPTTAGQRTGSQSLQRMEGMTGKGQGVAAEQAEAFTAQAMKSIGSKSSRASESALQEARNRIGGAMSDAVKGVTVSPSSGMLARLDDIQANYLQMAAKGTEVPLVGGIQRQVDAAIRSRTPIDASKVANWRSSLSKLTKSPDAATREAAIDSLNVLDGAISQSLSVAGRSADVAKLELARKQYRNLLAIEGAAARAGQSNQVGLISPSALRGEVSKQGKSAFARGQRGELADLAKAGEGVIKPLPTSGTAENLRAMGVPAAAGGGLGAYAASQAGLPAEIGMLAGLAGPSALRSGVMSKAGQRYFANQLMPSSGTPLDKVKLLGPLAALSASDR